jgi:hypothetical protein
MRCFDIQEHAKESMNTGLYAGRYRGARCRWCAARCVDGCLYPTNSVRRGIRHAMNIATMSACTVRGATFVIASLVLAFGQKIHSD